MNRPFGLRGRSESDEKSIATLLCRGESLSVRHIEDLEPEKGNFR